MGRNSAVHFTQTPHGDVLVNENGGHLSLGDAIRGQYHVRFPYTIEPGEQLLVEFDMPRGFWAIDAFAEIAPTDAMVPTIQWDPVYLSERASAVNPQETGDRYDPEGAITSKWFRYSGFIVADEADMETVSMFVRNDSAEPQVLIQAYFTALRRS